MKTIITLLCVLAAMHSNAQNNLSGKVSLKETNANVNGAIIYIPDLKTGTKSDSSGNFILKNLPNGKFLVECKKSGYGKQAMYVSVNGSTTLNFILEEEVVEIHEVTVTGTTQSTSLTENPVSITTMNQEALFQNTSTNLIDNISKKPGVNQLGTGAAISKPIIRGLGYNRIVSLNNGIRQEGQQWGDEHGIEIDEYSVDRVEIIKGPGSLMYGSDAIAGVVNFLAPNPLPVGEIRSTLLSNYQSNNHMQGYSLSNAGNINGFNWLVRGSMKLAGNYKNKYDGLVYNSGFNEKDVNGYIGLNKRWGYSHVHFSSFNQTIGMVEGERDSLGNFLMLEKINDTLAEEKTVTSDDLKGYRIDVPRQGISHNRISNSTKLFFGKSNLTINTGYQINQRKEFGEVLEPEVPGLRFSLSTLNYDLRYQLPEVNDWHFTLGLNGMHQKNANSGDEALVPDYTLLDIGGYFFTKKKVGQKLNVAGGLRYDNRNVNTKALYIDSLGVLSESKNNSNVEKFRSVEGNYNAFTGSLGFTYEFTKEFSAKVNIARGFRAPNIAEIGSNGKHEGTLRYEVGDAKLKAETSLQGDLGLTYAAEHISTELSVFYNDIQNYIYTRKLESESGGDSIADILDPAPVFVYTQGNALLYGGEYSIDIHPHPVHWLHIENSISMVTGMQKNMPDSMTYLPFIPAARYQGELRCEIKKLGKKINDFYVSTNINYFFEQNKIYSAYATETASPDYTLVNLGIGGTFVNNKGKTLLNFVLSCNNVLDVAYQSHLSRIRYAAVNPATNRTGVFNMGRNFSVKIFIPIDFKKQ